MPAGVIQADLYAVEQHLDILVLALIIAALGGQEREVVGAGKRIDGLADAAVVLEVGDLDAVGGIGIARGVGGAIGAGPAVPENVQAEPPGADR